MKNNHSIYRQRRKNLRTRLRSKKVNGFVTFEPADVYYVTGFPSEGCFVLSTLSGDFVFAPSLLAEHARSFIGKQSDIQVISSNSLWKDFERTITKLKLKKVGFDSEKVTVSLYHSLKGISNVHWDALPEFILEQRMIKDGHEISLISKACHVTHQSATQCLRKVEQGVSEEETAHHLQDLFKKGGSSKLAFETIVAFGENSAYPHHVVTHKKLQKNSAVLIDSGCAFEGYRSDLTRTGFYGKMTSKFREIYSIVQESQQAGIDAVRDGVPAHKIDSICRQVITKAGYGDYFIHGTGHGVGLDIHEPPRLGLRANGVLKSGMVVTVEPGIYLPGEFGVRIEDTVLVTKGGCRILTK